MMIAVKRSVDAILIPSGAKITLQEGSQVWVVQALGNAYTVHMNGSLVRVAGKEGEALGLVNLDEPDINLVSGSIEDKVWMQLKTCFDPEIPVNIVDLGLIYTCNILPVTMAQSLSSSVDQSLGPQYQVVIQMTLTVPGCGMGSVLIEDAKYKISLIHSVAAVTVDLVFDPPWDRTRMSEGAKLQLGLL